MGKLPAHLKDLRVAAVTDAPTAAQLAPECRLLALTPGRWREEWEDFQPHLLLLAPDPEGAAGGWGTLAGPLSQALTDLTHWAGARQIPVVFWSGAELSRLDSLLPAARAAQAVFLADIDGISRYKAQLHHQQVYHLHFAAQPALCSPAGGAPDWYGLCPSPDPQSQTLFDARVFALLAAGRIPVCPFSRGMKNYFGDLTVCTDGPAARDGLLERLGAQPMTRDKYRLLGLRKVLTQHLCAHRLGYITEKVFGVNMTPALPQVTVLARPEGEQQRERIKRMFEAQTLPGARLVLAEECEPDTRAAELCGPGLAAWWDGRDWYGPNYLLDLALSWRYGDFRGAGKVSHFAGPEGTLVDGNERYRPAAALIPRRALVRREALGDMTLAQLGADTPVEGEGLLGTDPFQYCRDWGADTCPAAEDLQITDQGLPLEKIQAAAQDCPPSSRRCRPLCITGAEMGLKLPDTQAGVTWTPSGTALTIHSSLAPGESGYLTPRNLAVRTAPWLAGGKLPVYFTCTADAALRLTLIPCDGTGKKLAYLYPRPNRPELLELPQETVRVRISIRLTGPGEAVIQALFIGQLAADRGPACHLLRSDTVALASQYPSPQDLYRYMFLHKRLTGYRDRGVVLDMLRVNALSVGGYREYEGINVLECRRGRLAALLDSGAVRTVCVHFLNRQLWDVLKGRLDKIRLLVWLHGSDVQPWWRRAFSYTAQEELERAKLQSQARMELWREVFQAAEQHPGIHFIFVSRYFAGEVMEDYQLSLRPEQYSVIHNPIDTRLFSYQKKDAEQRRRILTIKSFASRVYANDLTAAGILELAKRPCFSELEFDIYGDGPLFEEVNAPLRQFPNVHLHQRFLSQGEIAALHKTHGIFLASTRADSQGVSRCEAMSSGLVPIAHSCSAVPEFVDDTCGILIPPERYVELADAVEQLYNDPELFLRLSENAARRVRSQCARENTIDRELALILGGHSGA